ncbi:MAG: DUF4375 domain-containing protein [Planctomycetota bacterium]
MSELTWLEGYSGQTVEQLLALEGTHRIDSLVLAFEEALDQKAARAGAQSLTDEEHIVLAVEALEREVNNGGYDQFLVNSSREFAPVIVGALQCIGCARTADITQKALQALHLSVVTVDAIEELICTDDPDRSEILADCDREYFESSEDIEGQLFEFIKVNKSRIRP